MHKIFLILQTIRHLKPIQIRYQVWYRIRRYWRKLTGFKYVSSPDKEGYLVKLKPFIPKYVSRDNHQFTFLNQSKIFQEDNLDWNFNEFGKLWAYNLNYMDYLLQPIMDKPTGVLLIEDFIQQMPTNKTGLDPYPIALRGINWIKFFSRFKIQDSRFNNSLYAQYHILLDNIEYHLWGNHLLEDGFSLLFGAFYFSDKKLYPKAVEIIQSELKEQILGDGAHFELSPMYHQILLDRLLDCINLIQNNQQFEDQESLLIFLNEKAERMLKWINYMTFSNGQIPLLNDSAPGIAATTDQLNKYAISLGIIDENILREIRVNPFHLKESGYRSFQNNNYECIVDIGQIGPSYQPGHAHADTFSFVLNVNSMPFIVDTGISTYEANETRLKERGTASHNTVNIDNQNSSGVWSSFRVAHRAKVNIIKEDEISILAEHDGYRSMGTTHQRKWEFQENQIQVTDNLKGTYTTGKAHFWLAPQLKPESRGNVIYIENIIITFENAKKVAVIQAKIPVGYNKYEDTFKLELTFNDYLETTLTIN